MKRIIFALAALLALAAGCNPEIDPTSVTLNKHDLMLKVGGTEILEATIEPANASNTALSWSSTVPAVATVDQNGKVTAVSDGNTVITVTTIAGAKTDACNVYVSKNFVSVTGVKLDKATLELKVGDRIGLAPTVEPEDASNKTISWSSSAPDVASVNENGTVEALKGGKATITVKTDDGGFTANCEVTVSEIIVADGVTVTPATAEISEGATVQLSATVSPAEADQEVEWASMNTSVAKVDEKGLVTGVAKGTTRIYARSKEYPDKQGYCEVTVTQDATLKGISLSPSELTLTIGQTATLTVIYTPEYAANKKVSWASSNGDVATVSDEGKVIAIKEGTATITVTSEEGGFTASCTVTVSNAAGTRVYYKLHNVDGLFVNGEPDPLNGVFWVDERKSETIRAVCSSGSDLYTIEHYAKEGQWYDGRLYLCKNRQPVQMLETERHDDTIWGLNVRNGIVAIFVRRYYSTSCYFYAARINPDGTSVYSDVDGSYTNGSISPIKSALAPDGTYYIAGSIRDSFNDYYLALYKFAIDGNVTETLIARDINLSAMDISDDGDIYIAYYYQSSGYHVAIMKNGDVWHKNDQIEDSYPHLGLCCAGGHLFYGISYDSGRIVEYCDGNIIRTLEAGEKQRFLSDNTNYHPLQVSPSGDVYVSTKNHIFKNNNKLITTDTDIDQFCVVE